MRRGCWPRAGIDGEMISRYGSTRTSPTGTWKTLSPSRREVEGADIQHFEQPVPRTDIEGARPRAPLHQHTRHGG